jgi:hypothetical protein
MKFDPSLARARLEKFWSLHAEFGMEHNAYRVYLNEIVSDRYVLVNGLQLIRDELQLAGDEEVNDGEDVSAAPTSGLPSVMTTLAHTNCGDRIHQGEATTSLRTGRGLAASRPCRRSASYKLEAFSPTGGGTDDGNDARARHRGAPCSTSRSDKRFYRGTPAARTCS